MTEDHGRGPGQGRGGASRPSGRSGRPGPSDAGSPGRQGSSSSGSSGGPERRDSQGRQRGAARSEGRGRRSAAAPSQRARQGDPARTTAFDVLRQVADSDAYANLVLPPLLRERRIGGRDAAFATELAYGTLRMRGRYDAVLSFVVDRGLTNVEPAVLDLLRLGAHQLLGMRVPAHAAVSETVALARSRAGAGSAQFVNAILRQVADQPLDAWLQRIAAGAPDDVARLAAVWSHPAWIVRAMREALVGNGRPAGEIEALLAADDEAPQVTLVARPGLVTLDELESQAHGATPGLLAPTALRLGGGDPGAIAAVREGRAGVQDEGSQLVALALAHAPLEGPDERWLDLAAGPGGKAALLAAEAARRGARLVANEVQPHRARLVEDSLRAAPAGSVEEVRTGDGRLVGAAEPASYDRVLLDAPCTGLGALRRRPEARWRRTPADLAALTQLQRELLASALAAVRPGGLVAYVTCSPHLAETKLLVGDALKAAARAGTTATLVDARDVVADLVPGDAPDLGAGPHLQLWPHVHGTDAMHLSLLRRD